MAPIALAFAVLDLTGSKTDLGLVLTANWVPQLLLVLFGGVFADRLPRNLVMVGSNLLSGAAQGTIALLILTHHAELWQLIVLQVVPRDLDGLLLPRLAGAHPGDRAAGPAPAGERAARDDEERRQHPRRGPGRSARRDRRTGWALAFDGATYVASAAVLAFMRLHRAHRRETPSVLHELAEGWSEFASRTWLWVVVAAAAVGNTVWMGATMVLGPIVAKQYLGGAASWGLILASQGAGLLAGGLFLLRYRPQRLLLVGMGAFSLAALPIVFMASLRSTPVIAAGYFVAGVTLEIFSIIWATALQQYIPLEKLSRVSAYDALGSIVFIPLGLSLAGPVADAIGLTEALWLAAALGTASTLAALSVRDVRDLRRRDEAPIVAEPMLEAVP